MVRWGLYSLRNLWARRVTTALTVVGLGLVVFVLLAVLMLAHGLERTLGKTGDPENVIILRKGALSEIGSSLSREEIRAVAAQPDVRLTADGRPLAVAEVGLQLTLRKGQGGSLTSVTLRGTAPEALAVRPAIRLIQGRLWKPGTTEIVVGASIARQFPDARVDRVLHFGNWAWTVVGVFEAGGSGFDSEVWGDAEQFLATFHRATFSSMTLRLAHPATLPAFKDRIERDPRFKFSVKREPEYYEGKAEGLARMIRVTGLFL
ncbi:MAG: ABC transporter permease, partial [Nitrospira sp.]